jgi:hypothetical protein
LYYYKYYNYKKDLNGLCGLKNFACGSGCRLCWVSTQEIKNIKKDFGQKKKNQLTDFMNVLNEYRNEKLTKTAIDDCTSLLGILNSITNPPNWNLLGDPCLLSPIDLLHNEKLGLIMREVSHLWEILEIKQKEEFLKTLVKAQLPKNFEPISPTSFDPTTTLSGKEWEGIFWGTLPSILDILPLDAKIVKCLIHHTEYYQTLSKKKISIDEILKLKNRIETHHEIYLEIFPEDFEQVTETGKEHSLSFINFHLGKHWVYYILLFGAPIYFSVEQFEAKHKLMKDLIKNCSNLNDISYHVALLDHKNLFSGYLQEFNEEKINTKIKVKNRERKYQTNNNNLLDMYSYKSLLSGDSLYKVDDFILIRENKIGKIKKILAKKNKENIKILIQIGDEIEKSEIPCFVISNIKKESDIIVIEPKKITKKILLIKEKINNFFIFNIEVHV